MGRRSDRLTNAARLVAVGVVALAMSAIASTSAVAARAADAATTNPIAVHDSQFATPAPRAGQIRVNDAPRPAVAGTLPFVTGPLVVAFAGVAVTRFAALERFPTRVAIHPRAPPAFFA
jgi:hypothetical protein